MIPVVVFFGLILLLGIALSVSQAVQEPPYSAVVPLVEANVAVLPFDDLVRGGTLGRDLRARIEAALTRKPGVKVFSRTHLDIILQEQRLGALGLIEPATALEIGRLTGVNKIVTGTVLGAHVHATQGWVGLVTAVLSVMFQTPVSASELKARVSVQFQIIDAQTGRVETAETVTEEESVVLRERATGEEHAVAMSNVLEKVAENIASKIHGKYTDEVKYGLYKSIKKKGEKLEGLEPTTIFNRLDGQAVMLVYVKRVRPGATFRIEWLGPHNTVWSTPKQSVASGMWLPFVLPLLSCEPGIWTARGILNDQEIFSYSFSVY
ncbi:MAG: CsgG/HfaB family protein [Candidatus Bipolaricaulaceae bacterium]